MGFVALLVVIGTAIQAYQAMGQLQEERQSLGDWLAADILRREVGFGIQCAGIAVLEERSY